MKQYRVVVNGTEYEVAVECLGEADVQAASKAPAAPTAPAAVKGTPAGGEMVKAPMPGTILSVAAVEGRTVNKGDVLFILEAMKMENEIFASCSGVITGLSVKEGDSVQSGDQLCIIA